MRTLMTLVALAVVGAMAPAAPYTLRHASGTLAVFSAAVVLVLGTCILSGWLISEVWSTRPAEPRLLSRLTAPVPVEAALGAEWAAHSTAALQASALMAPRRATQLGGPGESILLRARTARHGLPAFLLEPAVLQGSDETQRR